MLTPAKIKATKSDDRLFRLLGAEIERLIGTGPGSEDDLDAFVSRLRSLPPGLRAMAATYQLDVSITLDDLGCHFNNWYHQDLAQETLSGLRELGAHEAADLFQEALSIATQQWEVFGSTDFLGEYATSGLEALLDPLTRQFWRLYGSTSPAQNGLLGIWAPYARQHPERCCIAA